MKNTASPALKKFNSLISRFDGSKGYSFTHSPATELFPESWQIKLEIGTVILIIRYQRAGGLAKRESLKKTAFCLGKPVTWNRARLHLA